eukprot:gene7510-7720_t
MAPASHTATASTSTLCKMLTWHLAGTWQKAAAAGAQPCLMHQADWLAYLLHGRPGVSDWNNALKLGFDPETESYPQWLSSQEFAALLPSQVLAPSSVIAPVAAAVASRSGLPSDCLVCAGTTDSIAAFVAAGVTAAGEAVTSLGSTMAVKLLSHTRVDDAAHGVYSHRLAMQPRLEPRPADDAIFLQGMLESMARIEARGYQLLADLGATPVRMVLTAGGGAVNPKWTAMRSAALGVPARPATQGEASYGAALLARDGWASRQQQQ